MATNPWAVVSTETIPKEMTFDVHSPDGTVKKQTYKNGSDLNDPIIETPLAPARPSQDGGWGVVSVEPVAKTDTQKKPWLSSPDLTTTSEHQMPHSLSDVGKEVARGVGNIGAAGLNLYKQVKDDPLGVVTNVFRHSVPGMALEAAMNHGKTIYYDPTTGTGETPDTAKAIVTHPLETAEGVIGQVGAADVAGRVLGPVSKGLADTVKNARKNVVEGVTGTGPKATANLVKETKLGNAAADAHSAVQASIETAREKALVEGNKKYNGVNEALNHYEADPVQFRRTFADAADTLADQRGKMPAVMKDLEDRINGTDVTGRPNPPINYDELQKFYSRLGNEISKGTLDGETYHAYDMLHDSIGEEMQRIADEHGQGAALKDARQYWRRMKQTFGKPFNATDSATSTMRSLSPEMTEQATVANRVRMLGAFDPEIPKQFERLTKAQRAAKDVSKPTPGETKKINTEDVHEAKAQGLQNRAELIRKGAQRIGKYGLGLKALWDVFTGNLEGAGEAAVIGATAYKAGGAIANALEKPEVVEFLTRPTAEDIAQIPPELRGSLPQIAAAAASKGIKVSPKLLALASAPRGPITQKLQQTADDARNGQPTQ